jgi:hypothetical protein
MTLTCFNGWETFAHYFGYFDSYKTSFALLTIDGSFVAFILKILTLFYILQGGWFCGGYPSNVLGFIFVLMLFHRV